MERNYQSRQQPANCPLPPFAELLCCHPEERRLRRRISTDPFPQTGSALIKRSASELARFLPRPAFHDDLRFRIKLHRVLALRVQMPKKLSFHPLNGKYAIGAATPMLMPMFPAGAS